MADETVTVGSGDVFTDLGLKREIGDLVEFRDNVGVVWRGVLLDIRRGYYDVATNYFCQTSESVGPSLHQPFGFLAVIAYGVIIAPLDKFAIVEKGWWHKKPDHPNRRSPLRRKRAPNGGSK